MGSQQNEIRLVLFDVGGVLVELSGLAILLSWLGHRITAEQVRTLWLTSPMVRSFETGKMEAAAFAEQMVAKLAAAFTVIVASRTRFWLASGWAWQLHVR
jgi:phosphoglycolate phosphatase-like HAD superfamily hydrolase